MENYTQSSTVSQQAIPFQLRFLLIPWKIYSSSLRPSYQLLLSRLYHFAKSKQNNIHASLQYLSAHYGTSYGTMRNVVYEARRAGLLASDSLKFIDISSFEMPPNPDDEEIYPPYLNIPEHALFHQDLNAAEKIVYALLYYRVNSDDASVRNPKKKLAESLGITTDVLKRKIKNFIELNLVEKASTGNKNRLYLKHYPTYIVERLDYTLEKLSTDNTTLGGQGGDKGGQGGDKEGVRAVTHINNNIRNKDNKTALPVKNKSFEEKEHDYVPEWGKVQPRGTTCTVVEFNSPEYHKQEIDRKALLDMSRKRGDAILRAYAERKESETEQDSKTDINVPQDALNGLHAVKQLLNMR